MLSKWALQFFITNNSNIVFNMKLHYYRTKFGHTLHTQKEARVEFENVT